MPDGGDLAVLAAFAFGVSVAGFALMGVDKRRARSRGRRIQEGTFHWLAAFGGGPGILAGMLAFRHKTRKPSFWVPVVFLMGLDVALLVLAIWWNQPHG